MHGLCTGLQGRGATSPLFFASFRQFYPRLLVHLVQEYGATKYLDYLGGTCFGKTLCDFMPIREAAFKNPDFYQLMTFQRCRSLLTYGVTDFTLSDCNNRFQIMSETT